MWGITLGCKPQHGAHVGSAATTPEHNENSVAITFKLSLKIFYDSKVHMTMFKM